MGRFSRPLTSIRAVSELRGVIEGFAARTAARRIADGADKRPLLEAFARLARTAAEDDVAGEIAADRDLHPLMIFTSRYNWISWRSTLPGPVPGICPGYSARGGNRRLPGPVTLRTTLPSPLSGVAQRLPRSARLGQLSDDVSGSPREPTDDRRPVAGVSGSRPIAGGGDFGPAAQGEVPRSPEPQPAQPLRVLVVTSEVARR